MALSKDVEFAVETLIDLGVLNEEGLKRLGGLFQGLQAFSGAFNLGEDFPGPKGPKKGFYAKGKPRKVPSQTSAVFGEGPSNGSGGEDHGVPAEVEKAAEADEGGEATETLVVPSLPPSQGYQPRKRAPKGSFNPTKLELQNLRDGGMTVKQIAELKDVSPATVNNKLREYGLTVPGRRGRLR